MKLGYNLNQFVFCVIRMLVSYRFLTNINNLLG